MFSTFDPLIDGVIICAQKIFINFLFIPKNCYTDAHSLLVQNANGWLGCLIFFHNIERCKNDLVHVSHDGLQNLPRPN